MASKRDQRLAALRAEAKRKERNAASKVQRLKAKGIVISNTVQDPRKGFADIAKMTARQLNDHIKTLENFTSRSNKYHRANNGTGISAGVLAAYQNAERRYNAKIDSLLDKYGDIHLPNSGMSVRDRVENVLPDSMRALGAVNDASFIRKLNRKPETMKDEAAVIKLTQDLQRKIKRGYLEGDIKRQRNQAKDMVEMFGHGALADMIDNLSDDQFYVLFKYSTFLQDSANYYHLQKMGATASDNPAFAHILEDGESDLHEIIKWASTLPKKIKRGDTGR